MIYQKIIIIHYYQMLHVSAARQIVTDFILTDTILNYSVFITYYNMSILVKKYWK